MLEFVQQLYNLISGLLQIKNMYVEMDNLRQFNVKAV